MFYLHNWSSMLCIKLFCLLTKCLLKNLVTRILEPSGLEPHTLPEIDHEIFKVILLKKDCYQFQAEVLLSLSRESVVRLTVWFHSIRLNQQLWSCLGGQVTLLHLFLDKLVYEGCSNISASSFTTFCTYMLRQNFIPFWKELFVAFKMAPNIKKHSLYFLSYRRLYKRHSCIQKFFWSKLPNTFWFMCGYSVISL